MQRDPNLSELKQQQESIQGGKKLTSKKKGRSTTINVKSRKFLQKNKILSRWTEYCSELNNHERYGNIAALDCN